MNQRLVRLLQLLKIKQEATSKAYLAVLKAKEQLEQNKQRKEQLISYKSEYLMQLEGLKNQEIYVDAIRSRLNFIAHLDTAMTQLSNYLTHLATVCSHVELRYRQAKISEEGVAKLISRVREAEELRLERAEQKESDEYAQKQWYSKNIENNKNNDK